MHYERRIIEAFTSNKIERILLIDDAYDPPTLDREFVAVLADSLADDECSEMWQACGIEQPVVASARQAAEEEDLDHTELNQVYSSLFERFAETNDSRFDLNDRFQVLKGSALAALRPLEVLLRRCGDSVQVQTVGLDDAMDLFREFCPHILFLDYYLSDEVPAEGPVSGHKMSSARQESLRLLKKLVGGEDAADIPAIVLMSTRRKPQVKRFRHELENNQILSLRFQFLNKNLLTIDDEEITVRNEAAEALLDVSQGYLFSKQIHQVLDKWRIGAKGALEDFLREVADLEVKDFAYLLRFRLRDDRQPIGEYLEWFFGESLKGLIEQKVEWSHSSFLELEDDSAAEQSIEGAHDGPTDMVARLYHRVRVGGYPGSSMRDYRLGDLYARKNAKRIRAVITPDCDLVKRDDGPKAKILLTVAGEKTSFDKKESSADDFLMHNERPSSVSWDTKNLKTFPLEGKKSLRGKGKFEFIGTLRPLYAQELQRRVLTDLSRLGLPVSPALGINVPIKVWIRLDDEGMQELQFVNKSVGTIIAQRRNQGSPRVLLRRSFFGELMEQLTQLDMETLAPKDQKYLRKLRGAEIYNALQEECLTKGVQVGTRTRGICSFAFGDEPDLTENAAWLQIGLKVSEKVAESIQIMDPIADSSGQSSIN